MSKLIENGDIFPRQVAKSDDRNARLRRVTGDSPIFGMNYGSIRTGEVKLGDAVYVAECEDDASKETWFPNIN